LDLLPHTGHFAFRNPCNIGNFSLRVPI
jgi:hypothetical protein